MTGASARVERTRDLERALGALGFGMPRPTLVLVGGAAGMSDEDGERLEPLFAELVATAEGLDAAVVDGGTDTGVMRLLGRERGRRAASFPLVGVVAESLARRTGEDGDGFPLEPNHSHFVLVPGETWGDETPWLARVAAHLSGRHPSVTLLVNGGDLAMEDVAESVKRRRRVVVARGSGRAADDLADALGDPAADERVRRLAASGLVRVVDLREDSGSVARTVREILSGGR